MTDHDIIVIGGSLGGIEALRALVANFDADLPAAVFVVLHTSARSPGTLGQILDSVGPLAARLAADNAPIEPGHIYVAPPDFHLLLQRDSMRLTRGPRENRTRPAIDPLFRTAAVAHGARVIGVILSGLLDDGVAGLSAVQRCGGLAVVQDPRDASFADMPRNALAAMQVDYTAPVSEMGDLLNRLTRIEAGVALPVPDDIRLEAQLSGQMADGVNELDVLGQRSTFSCPDCGGVMWALNDGDQRRYRCHIGHAYTEKVLAESQSDAVEQALIVALRTLEDRIKLLRRMTAEDGHVASSRSFTSEYTLRADELAAHIPQLHKLLLDIRNA